MRIRTRALAAALLSAALIAELPGSVVGATTGVRGVTGTTTGARGVVGATTGSRASSRGIVIGVGASAVPPTRIPVKEPPRTKAAVLPASAVRPKVVQAVRAAAGVRVNGLPMLRPNEIDRVLAPARRSSARSIAPAQSASAAAPVRGGRPVPVAPGTHVARGGTRTTLSLPSDPTASGTGINPWWRYQEENVPGGGRVMVNVGTGNLLLQDDDMAVPHKGIAMAFRRTYNSQASAAVLSTAWGNFQSLYGNGWTNTFDARFISQSATLKSVYDIDGARYDYSYNSSTGTMSSLTPGQHATMVFDGGCGWLWTKKSGTTYYFYTMNPNAAVTCPSLGTIGGYSGRLYQIIGRNRNTVLTFHYSWDNGDASINGKISTISATTESGMNATLSFGDVSGRRLLQQLTLPDNATSITYGYDAQGNLLTVSRPPNNASGTRPQRMYAYQTIGSDSEMLYAASPRWSASCAAGACGYDGGYLYFAFSGSSAATSTVNTLYHGAVVNPTIADGTNTVLQPGYQPLYANYSNFVTDYYTTGVATPTFRDTDGHMTNWIVDGTGRPTQTQECTASTSQGQQCTGTWLLLNESWDADNNLTSITDARGNETDYAYDANGNAVAVGEPLTSTSQGIFKPTKLYDYDGFNNVTAYCDESQTHAAGADWTSPPGASDSLCSSHAVAHARFTFGYPSYEPYGQLTAITTPMGYSRHITYAAGQQAGNDYGLPTSVTGDSYTQLDNSSITPTQTFWYDGSGNLRCYSKGQGTSVLSYDALGRTTSVADPDDSSANAGSLCGKSSGQSGWNTQTTYAYFPDGAKLSEQTPAERAYGVSTAYTYDLDGDLLTQTDHHGCVAQQSCPGGTTQKWYDGANRLVEVAQPHDSSPEAGPWILRYLYDLSATQGVRMTGSTTAFQAYGNLYKTQTYLGGGAGWTDQRGSEFDALNREVHKFSYSIASPQLGTSSALETTALQYDGGTPSAYGLLTKKTNPNGESVTNTYDAGGRILTQIYAGENGITPSESTAYDPNGRKVSITSSVYGTQQYVYDADGRATQSIEPSGGGLTDPAQLTYSYYPDGNKSAISVTSAHFTQANAIAYSYRIDGSLKTQALNAFGGATWTKQYTDAGRLTSVGGIDAQTRTYDATGQLATYGLGSTTLSYAHDPEGSVETTTMPNVTSAGNAPETETLTDTYNVRGEVVDQQYNPNSYSAFAHRHASSLAGYLGTWKVQLPSDNNPDPAPCADTPDYVNSVRIDNACSSPDAQYGTQNFSQGSDDLYSFDSTGRAVGHVSKTSTFNQWVGPNNRISAKNTAKQTTTTSTYDAENHLYAYHPVLVTTVKDAVTNQTTTTTNDYGTTTVGWGPNGHPVQVLNLWQAHAALPPMTMHWDGDMMLFVTDSSGNVIDFKVGLDGRADSGGVTAMDRDVAGVVIQYRNASGYSGVTPLDPSDLSGPTITGSPGFAGGPGWFPYLRSDGFQGLAVQINGVRGFDSTLGSWTTPDAFEGDVHDAASQQRYMWNRGNSIDYTDPSGFASELEVGIGPIYSDRHDYGNGLKPNPIPEAVAYRDEIFAGAVAHGVDPILMAALAAQESGGPGANSGRNIRQKNGGGHGLFQIDSGSWAPWLQTHHDGMDVGENADKAAEIMRDNLDAAHGNVTGALRIWNGGSIHATTTLTKWPDGAVLDHPASVMRHYSSILGLDK